MLAKVLKHAKLLTRPDSSEAAKLVKSHEVANLAEGLKAAKRLTWPKATKSGVRWLTPAGTTPSRLARGCLFPSFFVKLQLHR